MSVFCCVALIYQELRIQENHQMILNSANRCAKMETEIPRKVQQNIRGLYSLKPESTTRPATKDGENVNPSRQKRSALNVSQQDSNLTSAELQMLIKKELSLLQNQFFAKYHTLCRPGPKGNRGRFSRQSGNSGKTGSPRETRPKRTSWQTWTNSGSEAERNKRGHRNLQVRRV